MSTAQQNLRTRTQIEQQWLDDGVAAFKSGQFERAQQLFKSLLESSPNDLDALNLASVLALQFLQLDDAEHLLLRLIYLSPQMTSAHNNLGVCYLRKGRKEDAIDCYQKAQATNPEDKDSKSNLIELLNARKEGEEDADYYQRMIDLSVAGYADKKETYWLSLAKIKRENTQLNEAIDICQNAIDNGLKSAHTYGHLAYHLSLIHQNNRAIEAYKQAIEADSSYFDTYRSYGALLFNMRKYNEAEVILRQGIALNDQNSNAWTTLGNALSQQCQHTQAVECFIKAERLSPDDVLPPSAHLFAMNYLPQVSAAQIHAQALKAGRNLQLNKQPYEHWASDELTQRPKKLKIGFISPDLRDHAVGYFLETVMHAVAHDRFEWHAFTAHKGDDRVVKSLQKCFDSWNSVVGTTHEQAAKQVHDMGIDILFDLAGHTGNSRIEVLAYRPAPVQISWLGWFATTGLATMDYLLTDAISVEGIEHDFSEQLLYLTDTRLCMTPPPDADLDVVSLPAKLNGHLTFACVQNLAKISDDTLSLWGKILTALPSAKLQIQAKQFDDPEQREAFIQRAGRFGILSSSLKLLLPSNRKSYLHTLQQADILLDTQPYPGGTTTAEGLWMRVPTLTLAGHTMIAKQGASLLHAAGLDDWIAHSADEYVQKAVSWATRIDELAQLRAGLREHVAASALFDAPRFARDFERALDEAWQQHLSKKASSSMSPSKV